jgi:hypothetical protein
MSGKLLGQLEKSLLNLLKFEVGLTGQEYVISCWSPSVFNVY